VKYHCKQQSNDDGIIVVNSTLHNRTTAHDHAHTGQQHSAIQLHRSITRNLSVLTAIFQVNLG